MFGFSRRGRGLFLEKHVHPLVPIGSAVSGAVQAIPDSEPVSVALRHCLAGHRNVAVTDGRGERFRGMASSRILLDFLGGGGLYQIFLSRKMSLEVPVRRVMSTGFREIDRNDTLKQVLEVFKRTGAESMPLASGIRFDGLVRESDLVGQISRPTGVRVWEVMTRKPVVARTNHPVCEVAGMLVQGGFRRIPVVRDKYLAGLVTPHDILSYLSREGKLTGLRKERTELERAMNKVVFSVRPGADVSEAVSLMKEKNAAMLPVVEDYQLVGVLTQRDILEAM